MVKQEDKFQHSINYLTIMHHLTGALLCLLHEHNDRNVMVYFKPGDGNGNGVSSISDTGTYLF